MDKVIDDYTDRLLQAQIPDWVEEQVKRTKRQADLPNANSPLVENYGVELDTPRIQDNSPDSTRANSSLNTLID